MSSPRWTITVVRDRVEHIEVKFAKPSPEHGDKRRTNRTECFLEGILFDFVSFERRASEEDGMKCQREAYHDDDDEHRVSAELEHHPPDYLPSMARQMCSGRHRTIEMSARDDARMEGEWVLFMYEYP